MWAYSIHPYNMRRSVMHTQHPTILTAARLQLQYPHIGAAGDYVGTREHPTIHNRGAVADPAHLVMIHIVGDMPSEIANYA